MPPWIAFCYAVFLMTTSLWVILLIWVQQPISAALSYLLIAIWLIFASLCFYLREPRQGHLKYVQALYFISFTVVVGYFFLLKPQNDRQWQANVERIANYRFVDGQVEIQNVRNFIWHSDEQYTTQWETRRYALENIERVDLIVSHFI